jgi:type VI secretion system protein ImpG
MFNKYYQSELAYLRAMGKAFADVNPSTAGLLADRGTDPDVERLLEGFAFLVARIRERIDDSVPEMAHDLAEMLLPHYLRPLPACSIVEFQPVAGALRSRLKLPAESELASVPVDGTQCRFRTTADLDLLPVSVQEVAVDQAIGATPVVRVQLHAAQAALPAIFHPDGIRFFIQGDLPVASTLLLWFARHLKSVQVKGLGPSSRPIRLPPDAVRLVGFDPAFPLIPWPKLAPVGYRTLQEFFTLPQKFLFFEVRGLDRATPEERFEILFQCERPPELSARIGKETLRVNCVPVINLFKTSADPVSLATLGEDHMVRASGLPPAHMEIYSVEEATGIPEGPGERIPFEPFFGFRHGAAAREGSYYRLRRFLSPVDDGIDTYVSVSRPVDAGPGPGPATLTLEVTATNRSLPGRLNLGEISQPTAGSPVVARFRNLVAVTKPIRPPLGSELHWRLIAHLAANRASLAEVETLRALLDLYNFQGLMDYQSGRANRLRIEGIHSSEASVVRRLVEGAPVRGNQLALQLDEDHFASLGDAFLFASAVDELLASKMSINSFSELSVRLQPSQRDYRWRPRNGGRSLA